MDEAVADIFEDCLAQLAGGATVEECLAAHPAERAALEPLLRVATRLQALPPPAALPAAAQAALSGRVLAQLQAQRVATTGARPVSRAAPGRPGLDPSALLAGVLRAFGYRGPLAQPWLRLVATVIAVVLAIGLALSAYAAARAVFSALNPSSAALAPASNFNLVGPIEELSEAALVVAGVEVDLGPQTAIIGTPAVGAQVQVRGQIRDDGTLLAETVMVDAPAIGASPAVDASPTAAVTAQPPAAGATSLPGQPAVAPTDPPVATAAPAPAGSLWEQLRQLLEAGQADGRAGSAGQEFLNRLRVVEQTFEKGDAEKAGKQLGELYEKLSENVNAGKTDPGFAQQAQALIVAIGEAYQLPVLPEQEGGGNGGGNGNGQGGNNGNGDKEKEKDKEKDKKDKGD